MLFRCKNCNKLVDIDFYYSTKDHHGKISDMWQEAIDKATKECGCSSNENI